MKRAICLMMVACTSAQKSTPVGEVTIESATYDAAAPRRSGSWDDRPPEDATGQPAVLNPLAPATAYDVGPDTILILRRTTCFGACPAYSVGVRGDGSVHFFGESDTQTHGYASGNIGRAGVSGLLAFLRAKSFLSLHTRYFPTATDHPKAIIILRQGRSLKYVEHDASNRSEPALEAIENEIDRVTGATRWVGQPSSQGRAFQPPSQIPAADFARMAGPQLHAIERACAPGGGRSVQLTLSVGINQFGGAVLQGGSYPTAAAASYACLQRQVPALVFPLASVWQGSPLTFSLGP